MQIANYAVPLLLLPFLTRQLGMEAFGMVVIILAAIQVAYVLTDYGFSLSATYSISINREDVNFINNKISAVFGAKALLVTSIALTILVTYQAINYLEPYAPYIIPAFIAVIAQAFQPIWLFQGTERMKKITIYTVLAKILYAFLVLWLVSEPDDAAIVIYCWCIAQVAGLIASIYFTYSEGYRFTIPSFSEIRREFRQGAQFFWSRLAVAVYTAASTLVVGSQSAAQAAQFAVCEQIYKAGQNVTSPINNAMFPYMAKHKHWKVFYSVLTVVGTVMVIGCIALACYAEPLLNLLFGPEYGAAVPVLLIFLCTTIINYFGVTFGYSAFSALGRVELANRSVILGAIFHIILLLVVFFCFEIDAFSIAVATLLTETFVMAIRIALFTLVQLRLLRDHSTLL